MIFKSIVLLLSINSFVLPDEYDLLECYYNRYMMYYFNVRKIQFQSVFGEPKNINLDKLKEHSDELKTHGNIVIAMLEELERKNQVTTYPSTLMSINLYLNNVFGTLTVRTFLEPDGYPLLTMTEKYNKTNNIIKIQFERFNKKIIKDIYECVPQACKELQKVKDHYEQFKNYRYIDKTNILTRDDPETCPQPLEDLNDVLPDAINFEMNDNYTGEKYTASEVREPVQMLEDSSFTISHILDAANKNFEKSIFHPKQMLFHHLLSRELDRETEYDTAIDVLRDVTINETLSDGKYATIIKLFNMIKHSWNVDFIQQFQRQVLAASVYPVLACIGSYLSMVKQIFYLGENRYGNVDIRAKAHGEEIDKSGNSIHKSLLTFIKLNLLPEKVIKHLNITSQELKKLIDFKDKKHLQTREPKWIDIIYRRCSRPMTLNLLLFHDIGAPSTDMNSAENVNNMITTLNTNIEKVDIYIKALGENYTNDFNVVYKNPFLSFNRMFVENVKHKIVEKYKHDFKKFNEYETRIQTETPQLMGE